MEYSSYSDYPGNGKIINLHKTLLSLSAQLIFRMVTERIVICNIVLMGKTGKGMTQIQLYPKRNEGIV